MKKHFSKILLILLSLVLLFALVACNPEELEPAIPEEDPGFETAIYQVSFDSDGDTSFAEYNTKAKYDTKISAPMRDGKIVVPVKKGNVFQHWSIKVGTVDTKFDFAVDTIKDTTVLKAIYSPKEYNHTAYLFEKKDEATFNGNVTIPDNTKFVSKYGLDSKFTTPKTTLTDDYFVYWYYYPDNDSTKDSIRLTNLATKADNDKEDYSSVNEASAFYVDKPLTIFAMWYSILPTITVSYDTEDESAITSVSHKAVDPLLKPVPPTRNGYDFDSWYFIVKSTDTEKPDTHVPFVFDDPSTDKDKPTIVDKDITLHAKWIKSVSISSIADLNSNIYEIIYKKDPTDADKKAIEELCTANIHLYANITLVGTFKPFFTAENPFRGVFDAGIYGDKGVLTGNYAFSGVSKQTTLLGDTYVSLFGVSNGTIKNLDLKDFTLALDATAEVPARTAFIGAIASFNSGVLDSEGKTFTGGTIVNCNVTGLIINATSKNEVVVGGIAAKNSRGDINGCTVSFATCVVNAEGITLGGIAGTSESATIQNCTVKGTMTATATNDGVGTNGVAHANVGGLVGAINGGTCKQSKFEDMTINCTSIASNVTNVGGAVGKIQSAIITECFGAVTIVSNSDTDATVGGLVGYMSLASVKDCYTTATISSTATAGTASIGGLVGSMVSSGAQSTLTYSYATGTIKATASLSATVNTGGLIGYSYSGNSDGKNKIERCFTTVAVTATTNDTAKANLGVVVGFEKGLAGYTRVYLLGVDLTLNNNKYTEDKDNAHYFAMTEIGVVRDKDTSAITNVIAEATELKKDWFAAQLGFDELKIWTVVDGSYPTLQWAK